ncbi:AAA family ATPase [Aerosakkonemataceae cyanobacterium BLCC-F50]|uniref:histidine kinase n=1 Tax=Floridaenema flaviceps BLCC-F50 TaxID=3153642 RepID=A0ABV4XWD5_9CYAN
MLNTPPEIAGYQITEQIYAGSRTFVYRAIRKINSQRVIIKVLQKEYPSFSELVQFYNQYTITRNLHIANIIKPYSLEPYKNGYALVMEDNGFISLAQFIETAPLSLDQFLSIAIQLTDTLHHLHRERVIHKDIKPANILINPNNLQVQIIDFSIASLLPKESQEIQNPNVLEGTLAYISPEQTGRMNRGIDYRSDFYSLGVTFFQLLTGQLPFQAEEAIELVHCHIAQKPPNLQELNPQIPTVLSDIVLKLMAKNAEDRYQTALGIKHDLEICLQQLESTGEISNFTIGKGDLSDRFIIPEKLYGRQTEVETLLNAFERVATGKTELMLVAGFSGIGKTVVVNEVHKPIVRQRGYFIKGKFDQFNRNIPFSAFVQAFRDLMAQLLSESDTQLQKWKEKILQALGENGQVIIEVIPELECLIGKQPAVIELSGSAAQNRFNLLFQKFVQVFTSVEHPLVIFLDDLQWSDSASLKLLQLLMNDGGYLLIIGAYRDNEVSPVHPFMLTLNELIKTGAMVNTITLKPLSQGDINQLVADTLSCDRTIAQRFTELVYQKTKGNPFFTTQFLKALYEDKFIQFNADFGYWQCDITEIQKQSLTDDVVEFMAQQLQRLPLETQEVLKKAACIGATFNLHTLAIVSRQSEVETAQVLWRALQEGLIVPLNETYKFFTANLGDSETTQTTAVTYRFLHDRVQQAAYSMIPEQDRRKVHYEIGKLLLEEISASAIEEQSFAIVNQLNYGTQLITDQTKRDELAEINFLVCRKARTATAYQAAREYAEIGLNLLGSEAWERQYEMTLKLHELGAEVAALSGEFELMNKWIDAVIDRAKTPLEQVGVYTVKIQALSSQNKLLEAMNIGLSILKELGYDLTAQPTSKDILQAVQEIKKLIGDRPIEELFDLQAMEDAEKLATMQIAASIMPVCHQAGSLLLLLLIALQVKLSIQYGNSPISPYSYATYGILLNNFLDDVTTANRFSHLANRIVCEADPQNIRPETFMVIGGFLHHRQYHLRETLTILEAGYQLGLEAGKLEYVGYNGIEFSFNAYWCGQLLAELEPKVHTYRQQLLELNQLKTADYCLIVWEATVFLLGNPDKIEISLENVEDEEKLFSQLLSFNDLTRLVMFYMHRAMLRFLLGDVDRALADINRLKPHIAGVAGMVYEVGFYFYDSLISLASISQSNTELEIQQQRVQENQTKLQLWATHAPMNYLHKWQLVEAERYRVLGQKLEALEMYDRAISGAKENGYIQEEALANELAAKFYLDWGKEKFATGYIQEAYYCYSCWGAKVKTDHLEKCYPHLLAPILQRQRNKISLKDTLDLNTEQSSNSFIKTVQITLSNGSDNISDPLDFATILKAYQTLSSEIKLEQLLANLVQIVMENAGADKCALILLKDEHLVIEATAVLAANKKSIQASLLQSIPVESSPDIPISLINYVSRTKETLVIDDAMTKASLASDAYIQKQQPKSLLCNPIINQGKLIGVLYLENSLTYGVFTRRRLQIINILTSQAAISLEKANLYRKLEEYSFTLEQKVENRTQELREKASQLEATLQELYSTQSKLIQTEKMSGLGQLVAGIAHEINNPVNFIYANVTYANEYITALIELIELYQKFYPQPLAEIQAKIDDIDLRFIVYDLRKLLASMEMGSDRIRQIVNSLRNFSRLDEAEIKPVDIHSGIDSTLLILQHRLKANGQQQEIQVIKKYGKLPLVKCYASALNQVFMNILSNGIDSLRECEENGSLLNKKPTITIQTSINDSQQLVVRIADNGMGMDKSVLNKIFDPFFTTKPVGSGTGLGLSISYSIVVEKHQGKLSCISAPGEGAEFVIEIPI